MDDPGDELVEVVAADGSVERIVTRREMRRDRLRHRATFIAVASSDGRVLIHQRSPDKDVWPSRWDLAAGGVAAVGEAWADGARRELLEELGIDAQLVDLGRDTYDDEDVATVAAVFLAHHDGEVDFADGEVVDARWVDLAELEELVRTIPFCPDSVALVLPRVQAYLSADH